MLFRSHGLITICIGRSKKLKNERIKDNSNLIYKDSIDKTDVIAFLKAIALPSLVFILCLFTIYKFAKFGRIILSPLIVLMWGVALICAFLLPSQRESVVKETMVTIGIYCCTLLLLRVLIRIMSGASSGVLEASFDITIPETSGTTIIGYIQNVLYLGAVLTPLGFVGMQVKRIFQFKKNANKVKTFNQLRNIRDTNKNMQ